MLACLVDEISQQVSNSTTVPKRMNDPQPFSGRGLSTTPAHLDEVGTGNSDTCSAFLLGAHLSSFRVLVVDDFELFRQFVCSTVAGKPELQIVGEASDGLEAVQKAAELKPHLILLDIGLPSLNGIEAARQIRKLVPESKIIFLSQESSADVVREAMDLGAWGYVVKAKAGAELLAAVETGISGKKFVRSA